MAQLGGILSNSTLTSADVSDFSEGVQDVMNTTLVAGANVTLTYNDAANTLTIASAGGGGGGGFIDTIADTNSIDLTVAGTTLSAVIPATATPTIQSLTVSATGASAGVTVNNATPTGSGDSVVNFNSSGAFKGQIGYRNSLPGLFIYPGVTNQFPRVFVNWDDAGANAAHYGWYVSPGSFPNGSNAARGDSTTSDAAIVGGTSWIIYGGNPGVNYTGKGSLLPYYANFTISDASDGATPIYREGIGYQTYITSSSRGALVKGGEMLLTSTATKPARLTALSCVIAEGNAYFTDYTSTIFGAGSQYLNTGARGLDINAQGLKRLGTGLLLTGAGTFDGAVGESHYVRAIVLASNTTGDDLFVVDGFGRIGVNTTRNVTSNTGGFAAALNIGYEWIAGVSTAATVAAQGINFGGDVSLYRSAANTLKTDDFLLATGLTLTAADGTGFLRLNEQGSAVPAGALNTQLNAYMKADKFVIQFNNGGTTRYFTLDLTQSGATPAWAQSTTGP